MKLKYLVESVAYESLKFVEMDNGCYLLGSELAVRRVAAEFQTFKLGCSAWFNQQYNLSWWVKVPDNLELEV